MLKRFVALGLVGLFLVMSLVVAEDSIGPYNPIADVNKDGVVDILDLVEVGQAYGSNYTLAHQTNKTTITVLSFENNNFSFVENALVAVFPGGGEGQWKCTNSSGTVAFDLSVNASYVAIAWDDTRSSYNYADFTTDSSGEASVVIWLSYYPESSPIRSIPKGWIVMTFLNSTTGKPLIDTSRWGLDVFVLRFFNSTSGDWVFPGHGCEMGVTRTGILAVDARGWSDPYFFKQNMVYKGDWGNGQVGGHFVYDADEYGGSYVVEVIY